MNRNQGRSFPVPVAHTPGASVDAVSCNTMCEATSTDPDTCWGNQGRLLHQATPFSRLKDGSFDESGFEIRWNADA